MRNSVKARTPILALILFVFTFGQVLAANKVVVIPMGADLPMKGYCPPAKGKAASGPAALYNYCWYISAAGQTCDNACADVGGSNLADQVENEWSDTGCGGAIPSKGDVVTWFYNNGNPEGWTNTPVVTWLIPPHTLGFGVVGGNYFGKCASGTQNTFGAYPGDSNANNISAVCSCFDFAAP